MSPENKHRPELQMGIELIRSTVIATPILPRPGQPIMCITSPKYSRMFYIRLFCPAEDNNYIFILYKVLNV